jgi:hypothetical protein
VAIRDQRVDERVEDRALTDDRLGKRVEEALRAQGALSL